MKKCLLKLIVLVNIKLTTLVLGGHLMRLTTFDRLHQLTLMPRLFPVNCYVFEEENGLILIDAALKMAANSIIEFARQKNKPIHKIILTHSHMDHIGALDEVKKVFPEAVVYLSKRDARLFEGDLSLLPGEPQQKSKAVFRNIFVQNRMCLSKKGMRLDR